MNPDTGELRLLESDKDFIKALAEGFVPLPDKLMHAAKVKLNGNKSAFVSKTSGGKLSKFARTRRQELRRRSKSKRLRG